uniref:Uncharacterized protein n=1 Tax=Meloidogyne enterolobii TaxID=390850 RepID=A0A6V7TKS1_MELEN|nr:unnamed protein product [Meloidogyne enterolobii]
MGWQWFVKKWLQQKYLYVHVLFLNYLHPQSQKNKLAIAKYKKDRNPSLLAFVYSTTLHSF